MSQSGLYFSKQQGLEFARLAIATDRCPPMPVSWIGSKWETRYLKFKRFMETGVPEWTLFVIGNPKLGDAIVGWSTLPDITCPGAGSCLEFCYSFKAWRMPDAYFRQLQNTILVMRQSPYIVEAFDKLPQNADLRLYVDGDIDSVDTLEFWHRLLLTRRDIKAYGYSKSWQIFREYTGPIAPNYWLNLSSGSKYEGDTEMKLAMLKLQSTRGEYIAISGLGKNQHREMPEEKRSMAWSQWSKRIKELARAQGHTKVFVCPGNCQTCIPTGHACGSERFKDITIAIGVH